MREKCNFIAGEWQESSSGELIESRNPADQDDLVGVFPRSNQDDVDQAVQAAHQAQPAWAEKPAPERGAILHKAGDLLEKRTRETVDLLVREEGKTRSEAAAEVNRSIAILRFYAGSGRRLNGKTIASDDPQTFLYTTREPLGVVAVITPWNYPLAIPLWKLAPALVSGNAAVFKPASLTPAMAVHLTELLVEAGVPDGVLNLVTGPGSSVGDALCRHQGVSAVTFTGSYAVGEKIRQATAGRIRLQMEMGGKNPLVVMDDADLKLAVDVTISGGFAVTGQACTATSRVIVHQDVVDEYTERLLKRTRGLVIGNGLDDPDLGPQVSANELQSTLDYVELGQKEGAELLTGGERLSGSIYDKGFFISPAVFAGMTTDMSIAQEEVFGPFLGIIEVDSFNEAVTIANDIDYGLAASICTTNLAYGKRFAKEVNSGVVKVNRLTRGGIPQAPVAGRKQSGAETWPEQGAQAVEFYTRNKTVYVGW